MPGQVGVLWEMQTEFNRGFARFTDINPHTVAHLLEAVTVWANVILTQLDNTILPQSRRGIG